MTRVTQLGLTNNFLASINALARKLERDQLRLATGVNFHRPSDSPLQVGQILGFRAEIGRLSQFGRNVTDGQTQLSFLDDKFQSLVETTREARTLALQGINGSNTPTDRLAIARDMDAKLRDILFQGNSSLAGRYLFAGARTLDPPFSVFDSRSDSFLEDALYAGNQRDLARRINAASQLGINFTGDEVFLERTETIEGIVLPADRALGFSGTLIVNDREIAVGATDTLRDIQLRINLTEDLGASARIENGRLQVVSDYAVRGVELADDRDGDLLTDLGINLRGAFTIAQTTPLVGSLPMTDSTGAIFTAAGPVANLTIDNSNDLLNVHLGPSANEGTGVSHVIHIPQRTYTSVAELASTLQLEADLTFGRNRLVVTEVAGALEIRTAITGAAVGTGDLQIGGLIDGQVDTAADSATLNLVAGAGPAPLTNATTAGTDGTDRFLIDLGPLVSPDGVDYGPLVIDLDAANTGSVPALVEEINTQIRADVRLRGAVEARLTADGRIEFETVRTGRDLPASELVLSDVIPGVLAILGDFTPRPATLAGTASTAVPLLVDTTNRELIIDVGPSIATSGLNIGPITLILPQGTYTTSADLVTALNAQLAVHPELAGRIEFVAQTLAADSPLTLQTVETGSQFRAEDLAVSGTLVPFLGMSATLAADGAGSAPGQGAHLEARNLVRDLISLRDDLLQHATTEAIAKELMTADGEFLGLFDGDDITLTFEGRTVSFQHRAGETLGNVAAELQRILGTRAEVSIGRDGRLTLRNPGPSPIVGFSLTATSIRGEERTVFNRVMGALGSAIPGEGESRSEVLIDPRRLERSSGTHLGEVDLDLENLLGLEAQVGARVNRLELTTQVLGDSTALFAARRTEIEAVNIAELITQLDAQQLTLEAALQVGSRVLQPSLFNFLR